MSEDYVSDWIERVKSAYLAGDLAVANSLLLDALEEAGYHPQLLEVAGILAYIDRDFKRSVELIERAMFEFPLSISAQMTLAHARLKLGRNDAALDVFEFLVEMVTRVPCNMLADLATTVASTGRADWAIDVCEEARRRHPDDHHATFGVGYYMCRCGLDGNVARSYMEQAIEYDPKSSFYRTELASLLVELGEHDAAYEHIVQVSLQSLSAISCECHRVRFRELFKHQQDYLRLARLSDDSNKTGREIA